MRARLNSYRHTAPVVPPCGPSSSRGAGRISARSADVRAAQQRGVLTSRPPGGIVALMSFDVIVPTLRLALGLASALLIVDGLGWRAVAGMFNRERLVTGSRG